MRKRCGGSNFPKKNKPVKRLTALLLSLCALAAAFGEEADTLVPARRLRPLEVLGVKQMPAGRDAGAVTIVGAPTIRRLGIEAPKGVGSVAPNVYMPDYGSRMTSSIYVRGLGARIDQPVVGLSVDNLPVLNKDSYDFDLADIEQIEVLRGAQAVLNGRNTMGGQINIRTLSPLSTRGWRAMAEYGSANSLRASAGYYGSLSPGLGMSLTGLFRHSDGFFTNAYNGRKIDWENAGSLRWKTAWRPNNAFSLSNVASASLSRQGGYPYAPLGSDVIAYNDTCAYRRTTFGDALTIAWASKRVVVTSITSVQYLDDRMDLDQDFLPADYFTLTQSRREWAVTQDLFTRGVRGKYAWLGGVYGFYKRTSMDAPVTFYDTGIAQLIEKHRNEVNPEYPIRWDSRRFVLGSNFHMSDGGVAFYHQSSYALDRLTLEAGLRLDIERTSLSYNSRTNTGYTIMHRLPDGTETVFKKMPLDIDDYGSIGRTYIELLPKFTVRYRGDIEPYFTFSKGYKAGGYNTQMFSDVLQQRIMETMGITSLYSLEQIVAYKPEYSWNYEAGINFRIPRARLSGEAVLFYIDCRNQQLTVFPPGTTTGRIMTNAGRTRSMGLELSARYAPGDDWELTASYGLTNATFRSYNDGRADYRGKRLPYAPANTLFGMLTWSPQALTFAGISPSLTATARCAGNIYWNEANTERQPFYALAGLSLQLSAEHWSLRLAAENLTGTRYDTFYFLSMGNAFVQRGAPRRFTATLRFNL